MIDGRRILFQSVVGSHNYNLQDDNSDVDWKVYVAPTFDDLYDGVTFSKSTITLEKDVDTHDIRKLPLLLWKANLNFIEPLFSYQTVFCHSRASDKIREIFALKDDIVRMNLPVFYRAGIGTFEQKMSKLRDGTSGTAHLVKQHGYDTKQALHAWRMLDVLTRFHENDFTDFRSVLTFEEGGQRNFALRIKAGDFTEEEFCKMVYTKLHFGVYPLMEAYTSFAPDEALYAKLNEIVKEVVKISIEEELQ